MLFNPQFSSRPLLRHRCRNPRCGSKLRTPTDNRLNAFCCLTCFESFYRPRCLVCEQPFIRKTERRIVCGRAKCRHQFQRHRARFSGTRYLTSVLGPNGLRSPHFTGLKTGQKSGRPFCIVAGPALSPDAFRLATLPTEPKFTARLARAHAPFLEALKKAKRAAARRALTKRRHPPVNVLGGYKFPGALAVEMHRWQMDRTRWAAGTYDTAAGSQHADNFAAVAQQETARNHYQAKGSGVARC